MAPSHIDLILERQLILNKQSRAERIAQLRNRHLSKIFPMLTAFDKECTDLLCLLDNERREFSHCLVDPLLYRFCNMINIPEIKEITGTDVYIIPFPLKKQRANVIPMGRRPVILINEIDVLMAELTCTLFHEHHHCEHNNYEKFVKKFGYLYFPHITPGTAFSRADDPAFLDPIAYAHFQLLLNQDFIADTDGRVTPIDHLSWLILQLLSAYRCHECSPSAPSFHDQFLLFAAECRNSLTSLPVPRFHDHGMFMLAYLWTLIAHEFQHLVGKHGKRGSASLYSSFIKEGAADARPTAWQELEADLVAVWLWPVMATHRGWTIPSIFPAIGFASSCLTTYLAADYETHIALGRAMTLLERWICQFIRTKGSLKHLELVGSYPTEHERIHPLLGGMTAMVAPGGDHDIIFECILYMARLQVFMVGFCETMFETTPRTTWQPYCCEHGPRHHPMVPASALLRRIQTFHSLPDDQKMDITKSFEKEMAQGEEERMLFDDPFGYLSLADHLKKDVGKQ